MSAPTRDELLAVLHEGGPQIVFQPIVNLWSETVVGYEALSRFPAHTPDRWYAQAFELGLGDELERIAIANAVRSFESCHAPGYLSVNASPGLIARHDLSQVTTEHRFRVQLEVTETAPISDYRPVVRSLDRARRAGVTVAIDDVGAGYAAMRHVLYLAPDSLKLDRELVRGLHFVEEVARRAILSSMTALAARLQLDVVAEGIELHAEALALRALGINYGQGWHYSKPLTPDELRASISQG